MSKIFTTIMQRKIDLFINTFGSDSESLFKNIQNKLIHPGEFGTYREKCLGELLDFVLGNTLSISDGFIITSDNDISTQCDLLVYNGTQIPKIAEGYAKFFPIEVIKAIGEVKSNLTIPMLKEALRKLARNKMLCEKRKGVVQTRFENLGEYMYPFSFLVCKKIENFKSINFYDIYKDIPKKYWHNCILSIEDGLSTYKFDFRKYSSENQRRISQMGGNIDAGSFEYSFPINIYFGEEVESDLYYLDAKADNPYNHIIDFITHFGSVVPDIAEYRFDIVIYLDNETKNLFIK